MDNDNGNGTIIDHSNNVMTLYVDMSFNNKIRLDLGSLSYHRVPLQVLFHPHSISYNFVPI